MRKIKIMAVALGALVSVQVTAQESTEQASTETTTVESSDKNPQIQTKNGKNIMPVAGEFAIGMSANPFFQYAGDLFGRTASNTSLNGNKYFNGTSIFGKYMLSDDNAIRARVRIASFNSYYDNEVFDDLENNPDALVEDKYTSNSFTTNLSAGYEFRRGTSRFRCVYGGEVLYNYNTGINRTYEYGNDFGTGNIAPTATVWNSNSVNSERGIGERIISDKGNSTHAFGLRGFVGVEYYIIPKLAIGTEFGWGGTYSIQNDRLQVTERYDVASGEIITDDERFLGTNRLNIDVDNINGQIFMLFYF